MGRSDQGRIVPLEELFHRFAVTTPAANDQFDIQFLSHSQILGNLSAKQEA
jgi:hypothetical protein